MKIILQAVVMSNRTRLLQFEHQSM